MITEIIGLLPYAAPVAIAALGEIVGQKAGVINIGLEGMMLLGAFGALLGVTLFPSAWAVPCGFACACLVGALASAVSGYFTVVNGSDQVVVGTAINLLALGLTGTMFRARFGGSGHLLSVPTLTRFHGIDLVIAGTILAIPFVQFLLFGTRWGLAIRSVGEYPKASEAAGQSVVVLRLQALILSGLMAGLAGGYLVLGTTGSFAENMTSGRGFLAIALVTFGRWKPFWVASGAVMIGYLQTLQFSFQASGSPIPYQLLIASPYAAALLVLVVAGKGTTAPGALGVPFRRSK